MLIPLTLEFINYNIIDIFTQKFDYILKICENIGFDNHNVRTYDMIFSNKFT
jgi:hypothetical protein